MAHSQYVRRGREIIRRDGAAFPLGNANIEVTGTRGFEYGAEPPVIRQLVKDLVNWQYRTGRKLSLEAAGAQILGRYVRDSNKQSASSAGHSMAGNGRIFGPVDTTGFKMLVDLGEGKKVFERPLAEGRADGPLRLLRFGPKGIEQRSKYRIPEQQSKAWDRTLAFGSCSAPEKTMIRTGAYMKAWLGLGPGGMPPSTDESVVTCGVDPKSFPQVAIHQGSREEYTIRPKTPSKTSARTGLCGGSSGLWPGSG